MPLTSHLYLPSAAGHSSLSGGGGGQWAVAGAHHWAHPCHQG